jgi:alkyl sulfatase BDS1-like metallo-beta-lactamase superfamily hydrolase
MTARPHKILTAYSLPLSLVFAALGLLPGLLIAQDHFNPKGSQPSSHTSSLQSALRDSLPFEDERDFEEARRGLLPSLTRARSSARLEI